MSFHLATHLQASRLATIMTTRLKKAAQKPSLLDMRRHYFFLAARKLFKAALLQKQYDHIGYFNDGTLYKPGQ